MGKLQAFVGRGVLLVLFIESLGGLPVVALGAYSLVCTLMQSQIQGLTLLGRVELFPLVTASVQWSSLALCLEGLCNAASAFRGGEVHLAGCVLSGVRLSIIVLVLYGRGGSLMERCSERSRVGFVDLFVVIGENEFLFTLLNVVKYLVDILLGLPDRVFDDGGESIPHVVSHGEHLQGLAFDASNAVLNDFSQLLAHDNINHFEERFEGAVAFQVSESGRKMVSFKNP